MSDQKNILLISPFEKGEIQLEQVPLPKPTVPPPKTQAAKDPCKGKKGQALTKCRAEQAAKAAKAQGKTAGNRTNDPKDPYAGAGKGAGNLALPAFTAGESVTFNKLEDNINLVAAIRAYFIRSKKEGYGGGYDFKDNDMINLENTLQDIVEKVYNDNEEDSFDSTQLQKYRKDYLSRINKYVDKPSVIDLKKVIEQDLMNKADVLEPLKIIATSVLKSMRIEMDPTEFGEVADKSAEYIGEIFKSFIPFLGNALTFDGEAMGKSEQKTCLTSHPYATVFGMLSGAGYGGFVDAPLWSRVLKTGLAPITAPIEALATTEKVLAKTVDKVPYVGKVSSLGRAGVYVSLLGAAVGGAALYAGAGLPDDAEELNKLRKDINDGVIKSWIGDIPLRWAPQVVAEMIDELIGQNVPNTFPSVKRRIKNKAKNAVKDKSAEIQDSIRTSLEVAAQKQFDRLTSGVPITGKEWRTAVNKTTIKKFDKLISDSKKSRGKITSMNCYLFSVGGAFLLANMARGPLKKGSFKVREAFDRFSTEFGEFLSRAYRETRASKIKLFNLKNKDNHLAAWTSLKIISENEVLDFAMGSARIVRGVDGNPRISIYTAGAGGRISDKVEKFSINAIPQQYRDRFKAFVVTENGRSFVKIDLKKANEQLNELSSPVFERAMADLTKKVESSYSTGYTTSRLRRLSNMAEDINLSNVARLQQHYDSTGALIYRLIHVRDADGFKLAEKLEKLKKANDNIKEILTSPNIDSGEILDAVNKFQIKYPTITPSYDGIKEFLSGTTKVDARLQKVFNTQSKYEKFVSDLRAVDHLEKQLVAEFNLIDEMFIVEKRMRMKMGKNLEKAPVNFEDWMTRSSVGSGNLWHNSRTELWELYSKFQNHLKESVLALRNKLVDGWIAANAKVADFAEETAYLLTQVTSDTIQMLKNVNLRDIQKYLEENPKLYLIAAAGVGTFYNFLEALINSLSGMLKEEKDSNMQNFLKFIKNFKQQMENSKIKRGRENWIGYLEDFRLQQDPKKKLNMMFDLFRYIQGKSTQNNKKLKENRIIQMKKTDLRKLVSEMLNENSGMGYAKYPYHAEEYSEDEPDEDYMSEWKILVDEVCGAKRKNVDGDPSTQEDMAVEVAKLFVKDSDLFREVLELAGSNKSVGMEIMKQLKATKDNKNIDKELNV